MEFDEELAEATHRYVMADAREKLVRMALREPVTAEGLADVKKAEVETETAKREWMRLYRSRLGTCAARPRRDAIRAHE
jgi:hypothetical protein